jgi:hypothetical protein
VTHNLQLFPPASLGTWHTIIACMCMCMYMCMCMCVCACMCMYVHVHGHGHAAVHVHAQHAAVHNNVCMCTCMPSMQLCTSMCATVWQAMYAWVWLSQLKSSKRKEFWCAWKHNCRHAICDIHCTFHGQETILLRMEQMENCIECGNGANGKVWKRTVMSHDHMNQLVVLPVLLVMMHCC